MERPQSSLGKALGRIFKDAAPAPLLPRVASLAGKIFVEILMKIDREVFQRVYGADRLPLLAAIAKLRPLETSSDPLGSAGSWLCLRQFSPGFGGIIPITNTMLRVLVAQGLSWGGRGDRPSPNSLHSFRSVPCSLRREMRSTAPSLPPISRAKLSH